MCERIASAKIRGSGLVRSTSYRFLGFMSTSSLSPSRVAIAILCAGALAFACGPRTHSEAASTASLATAAPVVQQGAVHGHNDSAPLASRLDVKVEAQAVQFALQVTNETRKHIELAFPNGQTHEFVVLDSLGRERWRWSATRLFTQGFQNKLLGSGESMHYGEQWQHPLARGKYTVVATLNSTNYPVQERVEFVIP